MIRHWIEQLVPYENPQEERELLEAQQRDLMLLLARLDEQERRVQGRAKKERKQDA